MSLRVKNVIYIVQSHDYVMKIYTFFIKKLPKYVVKSTNLPIFDSKYRFQHFLTIEGCWLMYYTDEILTSGVIVFKQVGRGFEPI